ncbi:MAG TPA: methylmalonyl-CoA decarboxylase [Rhodocyclaceae bacterium]|nr:methylmalonyl-CoA decarboxylase [Rhodocyclaceae bacterium]
MIHKKLAEGIGTITLNYDAKLNIFGAHMVDQIGDALAEFQREGARAIILRANKGVRVWSAGHNVEELPKPGQDPLQWADPLRKLVRDIQSVSAPVIALLEGSVWGGACEVVFACDLIVAASTVTLVATPARLGVPYNATGLMTYLNAAPLRVAKEMLFTARPIGAERLERLGMINHMVPAEDIETFCAELAADIARNAPLAVGVMKEQLTILSAAQAMSPYEFERMQGLRRVVYSSNDYAEGIQALMEKRSPVFCGD